MTADAVAVALVLIAAPAATAVPLLYAGWVARRNWFRTVLGWALMTSSTGLALLIDISLLYNWLGDDYLFRDVVRLSVYSIIVTGAWLTLGALVYEWRHGHRR